MDTQVNSIIYVIVGVSLIVVLGFVATFLFVFRRARSESGDVFKDSFGGLSGGLGGASLGSFMATKPKQPLTCSVSALRSLAAGTPVSMCAKISTSNPKLVESFASFRQEEFQGMSPSDNERWVTVNQTTPPLVVELQDGPVQILNGDYELMITTTMSGSMSTSTESAVRNNQEICKLTVSINGRVETAHWDSAAGQGTRRYSGIEVGDNVLIEGKVETGPNGLALRAESVHGFRQRKSLLSTEPDQPNLS